jgi:hypothetical protein
MVGEVVVEAIRSIIAHSAMSLDTLLIVIIMLALLHLPLHRDGGILCLGIG